MLAEPHATTPLPLDSVNGKSAEKKKTCHHYFVTGKKQNVFQIIPFQTSKFGDRESTPLNQWKSSPSQQNSSLEHHTAAEEPPELTSVKEKRPFPKRHAPRVAQGLPVPRPRYRPTQRQRRTWNPDHTERTLDL